MYYLKEKCRCSIANIVLRGLESQIAQKSGASCAPSHFHQRVNSKLKNGTLKLSNIEEESERSCIARHVTLKYVVLQKEYRSGQCVLR